MCGRPWVSVQVKQLLSFKPVFFFNSSLHLTHNAIITFILLKCFENSVNCNCLTTFCNVCKFYLQNITICDIDICSRSVGLCAVIALMFIGMESLVSAPVLSECLPTELNASLSPTFPWCPWPSVRHSQRFLREHWCRALSAERGPIMVVMGIYVPCDPGGLGEH